jgi:hypothetical protein
MYIFKIFNDCMCNCRLAINCTNQEPCPPVDCTGVWLPAGPCDGPCGGGAGLLPERFSVTRQVRTLRYDVNWHKQAHASKVCVCDSAVYLVCSTALVLCTAFAVPAWRSIIATQVAQAIVRSYSCTAFITGMRSAADRLLNSNSTVSRIKAIWCFESKPSLSVSH